MPSTVTLISDRPQFISQWRGGLETEGLASTVVAPAELAAGTRPSGAVVVDGACEAYASEDDLLSAVGFLRTGGHVLLLSLVDRGGVDDVIDEICRGLVLREAGGMLRIIRALRRRLDPSRGRRFEYVTLSPREGEVLVILGDGESRAVRRPVSELDTGAEIIAIELIDDERGAKLTLKDGVVFEIRVTDVLGPSGDGAQGFAALSFDGSRLGSRLRQLRLDAGLTQAELAERTGIHRPNIARVEAGRHTPSLDTLARLADAIGVAPVRVLMEE